MGAIKSNSGIVSIVKNRIAAIQKYLVAEKAEIPVNGTVLKPSALMKLYQKSLDTRAAVTAGQAAHKGAITARDAAEGDRLAADENLKAWVLGRYGAGSVEAGEFGFAPRKAPAVTAATRARAVLQNEATRKARGTIGKKKKLAIKGVIPTSTEPAAPATSVTAAPPNAVALSAPLPPAPSAPAPTPAPAQVAAAAGTAPVVVPATTPALSAPVNGAGH
jgi:hypothetical protein